VAYAIGSDSHLVAQKFTLFPLPIFQTAPLQNTNYIKNLFNARPYRGFGMIKFRTTIFQELKSKKKPDFW